MMVHRQSGSGFSPSPLFYQLVYGQLTVATVLLAVQLVIPLPFDDNRWPLSFLSFFNLLAAGCLALCASFDYSGRRSVRWALVAIGLLFVAIPPLQLILPDSTVDYQDWVALIGWLISFILVGLILLRAQASVLIQVLFMSALALQGVAMTGDFTLDDFLRSEDGVAAMDWAYVIGSCASAICFLLGFQLFAANAIKASYLARFPNARADLSTTGQLSLEHSKSEIGYQAYIDGLRAAAVIPVVLYHAGFTTFSGGFVGVDVFFVISGFLITSLIAKDLETGKFSILGFYERRARRILPALFAVIAACSIAAWFMFMPEEFAYFGRSVIASSFFSSNILFFEEKGYFDTAAQLKPLLHTWSLAIEEQFYIFFPLLLLLLYKFFRSRLALTLLIIAIGSFALNLWATEKAPDFAFFMSPPRFWELLLGALLAVGAVPTTNSREIGQVAVAIGLSMIAIAVLTFSDETSFPGLAALLPCLGAALVLVGGRLNGPVVRLLSLRPVVFLGLISYSLYLWHWPIIVFVRYYFGEKPSVAQASLIVAASVLVAAVSWRWIEQPFRQRRYAISRPILFGSAAAATVWAVTFGFAVEFLDGVPSRLPAQAQVAYSAKSDSYDSKSLPCLEGEKDYLRDMGEVEGCPRLLGPALQPVRYVVWGDSHAEAIAPGIEEAGAKAGKAGLLLSRGSCPPLLDFNTGASNKENLARCWHYNQLAIELLRDQRIPLVFLVARWPKYSHHSEYGNEGVFFSPKDTISLEDFSAPLRNALDSTVANLIRNNVKPILVMDVPEPGYDVPDALAKAALTGSNDPIELLWPAVERRQQLAKTVLHEIASKYKLTVIDPTPEFCDKILCAVRKNGKILYRDADHLTATGAKIISHIFDASFTPRK